VIEREEELKIGSTTDACLSVILAMIYTQYAILFSYLLNIKKATTQKTNPYPAAHSQLSRVGY
jgi:hypothetical protein